MPAKTCAGIVTRVKDLVLDIDDMTDPTDFEEWIQEAQEALEERHGFLKMETILSSSTTSATRKVTDIPAAWVRSRMKPWYVDSNDKVKEMDWILEDTELIRLYNPDDSDETGAPAHLHINEADGQIDVYPLSDDNGPLALGQYSLRIPYFARQAALSGSTSNWFSQNASPYLEFYAAARGCNYNRDYEAEVDYQARAEAAAQRVIRLDNKKRALKTTVWRPRRDVLAPPNQPRMS